MLAKLLSQAAEHEQLFDPTLQNFIQLLKDFGDEEEKYFGKT